MTRSKRSSSPASRCIGCSNVSWSWMSAPGTPWRSMFSLQIDQAEASLTWPQRRRFVGSPPDCSMNSRLMMSMPPEPQRGVVDAQARLGLEDADHEPDDVARRVEVAALLARRLGEHVDEELVGGAEQVGELEILVAQAVSAEVADEILAGVVGDDALVALHAHEADVVEDVFERCRCARLSAAKCLVEDAAVRLCCVA